MPHSYKGAIAFGLVYIPITLSPAVRENDVGFNMLERSTLSRVKYKKTCVDCDGREVANHEIVKGFQYERDKYVIFTDEDFEILKSTKDKQITISKFVDLSEVDPVYFERAYHVNPLGAEKPYALLALAMEKQNRAGIAKTVLGTKEVLVLLRAKDGIMFANTLYFHDEVKRAPQFDKPKVATEELALAKNLINNMVAKFEPQKFKDEYNERLRKAIEQKVAGKELEAQDDDAPQNVINMMDALKKSVAMTANG